MLITITVAACTAAACATAESTPNGPSGTSSGNNDPNDASSSSSESDGLAKAPTSGGSKANDDAGDAARVRKKIDGDPANPKSCDAICAEHGLLCAPDPDDFGGAGGLVMLFGIDGGKPCGQIGYCFDVPGTPSDCNVKDRYDPLVSYYCVCH